MCSDVNDVEDGELDDEEDGDDDAAMASPRDAKVSDQGWMNLLTLCYRSQGWHLTAKIKDRRYGLGS